MKRIRLLIAAVIATSVLGIAAPPAHAWCPPDTGAGEPGCPPCAEKINGIWQKLKGEDLIYCPM